MSELTIARGTRADFRLQLLASASAFVLIGTVAGAEAHSGEDADRPVVWIELGGQMEQMPSVESSIAPPFALDAPPFFQAVSPLAVQSPPRSDVGAEGKLTLQPAGSDWVLAASVRFGRTKGQKHVHNQIDVPQVVATAQNANHIYTPAYFNDGQSNYRESHTVLDFAVGKDVGLGLFGDAVASLGVRYAQFGTASAVTISSLPDFIKFRRKNPLGKYFSAHGHHQYSAATQAERDFHGIGPSLSITGDVPLAGGHGANVLTFDWGVNGALLFGRQRATASHNTHGYYLHATRSNFHTSYGRTNGHTQRRSVTIPNIGGFAGISYRFPNAKLSLGYRADFFIGAMDSGLDVRQSAAKGFHGPFATVSFGLGG